MLRSNRGRMDGMQHKEHKEQVEQVDLQVGASDGGLKELVLRWFNETQAPLILHNGNFPDWFKGFAGRRDTEDLLRDKPPGCFLLRLSDRAIGYILSYRGQDRCRHFVITQNAERQFVILGDHRTHGSLAELIEHYRASPIQPFGEYLTSSWLEVNTVELYDVVNYKAKGKSGLSVQALRTLWDQKHGPHGGPGKNQKVQRQSDAPAVPLPALPPKSKSRKLKGTVSVDTMSLTQDVPPVPKRGLLLGLPLSGSLPDTTSQTRSGPNGSEGVRGNTTPPLMSDRDPFRSTSLPMLTHSLMEEEEEEEEERGHSNQLSSTISSSPTPLQRTTCLTYSLYDTRDKPSSSRSEQQGGEVSRSNPLYQTSAGGVTYAEVPPRRTPSGPPDDTYEQIPDEVQGNTYESLEDVKNMKPLSTWGKNYVKLKKFFPDSKKK